MLNLCRVFAPLSKPFGFGGRSPRKGYITWLVSIFWGKIVERARSIFTTIKRLHIRKIYILPIHLMFMEVNQMKQMAQTTFRGISKIDLYEALTGFKRFDDHPRISQFSGHPISIDSSVEAEMDRALVLVKKMERQYSGNNPLAGYYQTCFQEVDKAYLSGNPEKFKKSLQSLTDSIYME